MFPHLPLLMSEDAHIASCEGAAKQDIACCLVFGKICVYVVVFHSSFE
jgi:hypothetical protein